jgi:hypothetical protein
MRKQEKALVWSETNHTIKQDKLKILQEAKLIGRFPTSKKTSLKTEIFEQENLCFSKEKARRGLKFSLEAHRSKRNWK